MNELEFCIYALQMWCVHYCAHHSTEVFSFHNNNFRKFSVHGAESKHTLVALVKLIYSPSQGSNNKTKKKKESVFSPSDFLFLSGYLKKVFMFSSTMLKTEDSPIVNA